MAGASGGLLAGRVSAAGGFGFIGAGQFVTQRLNGSPLSPSYKQGDYVNNPAKFKVEIDIAREEIKRGLPVLGSDPDIGVGFLCWKGKPAKELLSAALDSRVKAVWFAAGDDMGQWVENVRQRDREDNIKNEESGVIGKKKTLVFVQVGSVADALIAANDWKVDCLVAQGLLHDVLN
jgi:nitronate monooxygenase